MKVICSTSNAYLHILPIFIHLFNKYWPDQECTIVGYTQPDIELPENMEFVSMGIQGDVSEWSTDLRKYFESIEDEWFIWIMEDTFIKGVDEINFDQCCAVMMDGVGRIDLTNDVQKREHSIDNLGYVHAHPESRYRLSTQPSIWNKSFLLQYLTDGLNPWEFEVQDPKNDEWAILGYKDKAVNSNEGVRKNDIYKYDLNGFDEETLSELKIITDGIHIQ